MFVFDFHTHVYPDKIAPRAIENVTRLGIIHNASDGTILGYQNEMKRAGIHYALNLPLALNPESERGINRWAADLNNAGNGLFSLGSIHPDSPEPEQILQWIHSLGLRGIKLHSEFQKFRPNDPRMDRIYKVCEELGLFILFHMGKDLIFCNPPSAQLIDFEEVTKKYPKLKIVLAHLGGIELLHGEPRPDFSQNPNVFFDLAYVLNFLNGEELATFIRRLGVNQVLFGTDSPWVDLQAYTQKFKETPLTTEEFAKILCNNACKLLHIEPKNV